MRNKKVKLNKKSYGFMMVEILVAASIMTVIILAVMSVAQKTISVSRVSVESTQASFLLEEGAEVARTIRDNGWSNVLALNTSTTYYPTFTGGVWTLSSTPNTIGIFTRTVNISNVNRDNTTADISVTGTNDTGTKLITVTVTWVDGGQTITRTLPFYISDIFS
ncbi:MAG: hypothetical protein WCI41_00015 [bacterium]